MSEITQADCEAAAAFARSVREGGLGDGMSLSERFAQHRLQARTQALEEAAQVAEGQSESSQMYSTRKMTRTIATAIRNLITHDSTTTPPPGSKGDD